LLVLSPCALAEILGYLYNNVQQYKTDGWVRSETSE
jgi:hypothetical protein